MTTSTQRKDSWLRGLTLNRHILFTLYSHTATPLAPSRPPIPPPPHLHRISAAEGYPNVNVVQVRCHPGAQHVQPLTASITDQNTSAPFSLQEEMHDGRNNGRGRGMMEGHGGRNDGRGRGMVGGA